MIPDFKWRDEVTKRKQWRRSNTTETRHVLTPKHDRFYVLATRKRHWPYNDSVGTVALHRCVIWLTDSEDTMVQ